MSTKFDLALHSTFISDHAESLSWFRARKCPCGRDGDANRSSLNCLACEGTGYLYDDAITLEGMITGVNAQVNRMLLETGILDMGDLLCSLLPQAPPIADWDKFIISGWATGSPYSGEVKVRGYEAFDFLFYTPLSVDRVYSVNPYTGATTIYAEGTSYAITGRKLTWLAAAPQPEPSHPYAVSDLPQWTWLAFNLTGERREQGDQLGQRVILRRRHAVMPAKADDA